MSALARSHGLDPSQLYA
ncbi:MAG: hypothetical protein U1E46_00020 [Hyphomicrobiales bacterium]